MTTLSLTVFPLNGAATALPVEIDTLVIAGWAGRDAQAIQAHIDELAALGVAPPTSTPCFYRVAASQLTQAETVEVLGTHTSGEVECVLLDSPLGTLVTIGSDHTDRKAEAYSVAVSKQVCAKPLAREAWRYADVAAHWDQLQLRATVVDASGQARPYQRGAVDGLLPPPALWRGYAQTEGAHAMSEAHEGALPARCAMFSGTLAVHGELAAMTSGDAFEMELHDPVLGRSLRQRYSVRALPVVA
ncbi:DUF2848 domain-containing protein [Paraburkholderia silviterrae]|uniref:DUF2848 domain-containing protein n=1 Tax=Paraburkholderia silviterrae TaxID=2528715 RepID=A0A4R5M1X8_9BURK|nr:DUF2848 domain-containing protein [Paraburkholderia silviterrae]TDG19355.1 DUF2848 domain-containing protein [Paraburkholderia silviterrae]